MVALARTQLLIQRLVGGDGGGLCLISKNADTTNTSVTFTRLDSLDVNSPARFITGYFGRSSEFKSCLDFIRELQRANADYARTCVLRDVRPRCGAPRHGRSWMDRDRRRSRLPCNSIAFDSVNGDLYVANDWGVSDVRTVRPIGWSREPAFPWLRSQVLRSCQVHGSCTLPPTGGAHGY